MSFAPDQQKRVGSFTSVAIYLQIFEFSRTFCHFAFEFSVLFDVLVILNFPYFVTFLELVIAIHEISLLLTLRVTLPQHLRMKVLVSKYNFSLY